MQRVWLLRKLRPLDLPALRIRVPALDPKILTAKRVEYRKTAGARSELNALRVKYGLLVDDEWRMDKRIWVYPPDWLTQLGLDPREDEHFCDSWEEAATYAREIGERCDANADKRASAELEVAAADATG